MKYKNRTITVIATAVLALGGVTTPCWAQKVTTLRVGNWLPMNQLIVKGIIKPWTEAIEADSDGTLKFNIMTSAIGRPAQYIDLVKKGAIDVGYGVAGHNPGRFPMTQVMTLPFMSPDPWAGSAAAWATYDHYGEKYGEFKGVKVVGLWVHSQPALFMRKGKPVKTLTDLKGKKIRVGGTFTGEMIDMLGGTPVRFPPTDAQQAMANGVTDGITFPASSIGFFKITPYVASETRIPGGLYTDTFWLAFNQKTWEKLTEKQRSAIKKNSGMAVALLAGWAWTDGDKLANKALNKKGIERYAWSDADIKKAKAELQPLTDEWLKEAKKRDLPGPEILNYAKKMAGYYRADKAVNVP